MLFKCVPGADTDGHTSHVTLALIDAPAGLTANRWRGETAVSVLAVNYSLSGTTRAVATALASERRRSRGTPLRPLFARLWGLPQSRLRQLEGQPARH